MTGIRSRILPQSAERGVGRLLAARSVRALSDGLVATTIAAYLTARGFSGGQIGLLITATLLGSAVVVMAAAANASRLAPAVILRWCSIAMIATGIGFAVIPWYWLLVAVAAFGPLNPSGGDVSAFLPAEQSTLTAMVSDGDRTAMFARYNLIASASAAAGALVAGVPLWFGRRWGWSDSAALRLVFWAYALVGSIAALLYASLARVRGPAPRSSKLGASKARIRKLSALFALDSAGGGFAVQSLVALWLSRRHHFTLAGIGLILSATSLLSATSALLAPRLARRLGLVRTMVFTHIPANVLLICCALAPNSTVAVACLLGRSLLAQLDVPARQSYVMAIVEPAERVAAAAYTNVPRSLAAATTPAIAGWLLDRSDVGWPLMIAGLIKITYDLLLLVTFGAIRPPEESR